MTCRHGNEVMYLDDWEDWCSRLSDEQCIQWMPLFCPCRPPSKLQVRGMEELILMARESRIEKEQFYARSEMKKKTPAPSVKEDGPGRWYMVTFTQPDTVTEPMALLKRTQKVIKSKMVSPNQWCYSLELTEKGIPHTHIRFHTDKYFDYKKVKNFNAGYIADVLVEKFDTANYVVKEKSKPSPEWLASYGLPNCVWYSENYSGPKLISDSNV